MKCSLPTSVAALVALACVLPANAAEEEAVTIEGVIVEAPFDVRLELPSQYAVEKMIERLTLRAETQRAKELEIANRSPITTILDLTKHSPIPISDTGSGRPIDTFFYQNYMRANLNPPTDSRLFKRER